MPHDYEHMSDTYTMMTWLLQCHKEVVLQFMYNLREPLSYMWFIDQSMIYVIHDYMLQSLTIKCEWGLLREKNTKNILVLFRKKRFYICKIIANLIIKNIYMQKRAIPFRQKSQEEIAGQQDDQKLKQRERKRVGIMYT